MANAGQGQRNGLVDIMRLIFAGIIMMHHFYAVDRKHFPAGWLGVEFFVILAGFLMFSAWEKHRISFQPMEERQRIWLGYMKRRYFKFFWYALVAFAAAFFVRRIWLGQLSGLANVGDTLSEDIWEILLVKASFGKTLLNTTWTLNCMLFAEFLILGMLTFCRRPFLSLLMPLSLILGTACWMNLEDTSFNAFYSFLTAGMLHVYLLTCFGMLSYSICQKLKQLSFSTTGRIVLTGVELLGYGLCMAMTLYKVTKYHQYCFILIIMFTLAVSFSGKSFAGSMLPANTFTNFCAELSLNLYLTHHPVLVAFRDILFKDADINHLYRQKFVFLYCVLAVALAYTYIMRGVFKVLPIMKEKLKSVMLEQP